MPMPHRTVYRAPISCPCSLGADWCSLGADLCSLGADWCSLGADLCNPIAWCVRFTSSGMNPGMGMGMGMYGFDPMMFMPHDPYGQAGMQGGMLPMPPISMPPQVPPVMMQPPSGHHAGGGRDHSGRGGDGGGGGGMGNPVSAPPNQSGRKLTYAEELRAQMELDKRTKDAAKRREKEQDEQDQRDREENVYDPFGKGGAGAPMKVSVAWACIPTPSFGARFCRISPRTRRKVCSRCPFTTHKEEDMFTLYIRNPLIAALQFNFAPGSTASGRRRQGCRRLPSAGPRRGVARAPGPIAVPDPGRAPAPAPAGPTAAEGVVCGCLSEWPPRRGGEAATGAGRLRPGRTRGGRVQLTTAGRWRWQ